MEMKKTKNIFFILGILLIILGGGLYIFKNHSSKEMNEETKETAFFLENNEGKYAVFDRKGNRITDFIYDRVYGDGFTGNYAVVSKDNETGVISNTGKTVIEFGKYFTIFPRKNFFEVTTEDSYEEYLIDSKERKIANLEEETVIPSLNLKSLLILKNNETSKFRVIDKKGKVIDEWNFPTEKTEISESEVGRYASIFQNDKVRIYDLKTGKKRIEIPSNEKCSIEDVNDIDGEEISLWCDGQRDKIVTKKNQVIEPECNFVYYENGRTVCVNGNITSILDENYNSIASYLGGYINYEDLSYAKNVETAVEFYDQNNNIIKTVECRYLRGTENGIYRLSIESGGECPAMTGYEYYNSKGEKIGDKVYQDIKSFNKNGYAIVYENNVASIIDKKGNTVSENYKSMIDREDYFEAAGLNGEQVILNKNGKVIIQVTNAIAIYKTENYYYIVEESQGKNKYTYYTLDGKKFYER